MIDFLDMDGNKLVIADFYENDKAGKYNYNAIYQRDRVWSQEKKSFLIDSILKNYPIPPIFLRLCINADTGKTTYDVIDGKQRLTSIREFIEGKFPLPDDFGDDYVGNADLNGASFSDLDNFEKYKKQFWRYRIPVIFIETEDEKLIKNVFDRLNRNGEPLVPQELRHAMYSGSDLYSMLDKLTTEFCWSDVLKHVVEVPRMEDREFVSELLFLITEQRINDYTKETLDALYKKYENDMKQEYYKIFNAVSDYIGNMKLDYGTLKIDKVSHLYAVWAVGMLGTEQQVPAEQLGTALTKFYNLYNQKSQEYSEVKAYKNSMSANTKSRSSRRKRTQALVDYCKSNCIAIEMTL